MASLRLSRSRAPRSCKKTNAAKRYFHKGLLWRAQEAQEVASYELFIDLFYVAIIAISGDNSAETADGIGLLRFAITFIMAWKFWSDISMCISWIDADDIVRRLAVLFALACLLGLTTNMTNAFEDTWTPLVAFYITSRWFNSLYFYWMAYLIPMVRPVMIVHATAMLIPGFLWIASIYTEDPARQALVWPAIFLDLFGTILSITLSRGGAWMGSKISNWCKSTFEFIPGNNIEHRIERTNAFVSLVFGYSVVSLLYQSSVPFGINGFFGKAVLGLIQAFSFNWLYFELDTFNMRVHAIRRHFISAFVWLSIHLPFVMSFVLSGSALSRIVLAHDFPGARTSTLTATFADKSDAEVSIGLRWYYCCGLGIALASTGAVRLSHTFRTMPFLRCPKSYLLTLRFTVALAITLLPLSGDRLNSLELVATTTSLIVLVVIAELIGNTQRGEAFWGFQSGCRKRRCTYSAKCGVTKKDIETSLKSGAVINVEELARRDGQDAMANEGYAI